MQPTRIAELLEPFLQEANDQRLTTSDALYYHISTYIDILLHWNARINLTAIRNEEEIVTRHFGESLFAARHLFPTTAHVEKGASPVVSGRSPADREGHGFSPAGRGLEKGTGALAPEGRAVANDQRPRTNDRIERLADLGSGAGFPGIPIKLWAPELSVTLIESNHKKATFLREVVRSLTLTNINIQNVRAETLPPSSFDLVTLRAVERLHEALPVAANLLTPGGRLALLVSSAQQEAIVSTLRNFAWKSPMPIPNSESRQLLVGQK